jgi:hypothetical protein
VYWTLECNKLPLWIEPCEFVKICPTNFENMQENFVNLLTLKCDETIMKMCPKNSKCAQNIVFKFWKYDENSWKFRFRKCTQNVWKVRPKI